MTRIIESIGVALSGFVVVLFGLLWVVGALAGLAIPILLVVVLYKFLTGTL